MRIDALNWFEYRELWEVTEWRNGCVYRTKFVRYVHCDYVTSKNEILAPLPTKLLKEGGDIPLEN